MKIVYLRDPQEYSPRSREVLPVHTPLTHGPRGTLRALFVETAPRVRKRRR